MFERKRWHRITAVLLVLTMLFTSIPAMAFAESTSEEPDAGQDVPAEEMTLEDTLILEEGLSEDMIIEEESTETSTTFDLGDGRKTVIYHGQQVRYEDEEGNLTDYDPSLVSTETGTSTGGEDLTGYTYENRTGDMKQYIPEKLNEETPLLMENGDYAITMAPYQEKEKKEKVKKEKDEYLTPYEKIEQKAVNAVYEGETVSYEYQSMNQGVKETLVLHEAPENNTFSYLVTAKGMEAELLESGVIVFTDRKTEKETAYIDKPFMNDATGEAYSEAIEVSMKKKAAGKYIVTYTLDEEYLNDKERVYPVSVDPTATWKGDDEFKDVYVISGSYANTNFYDSDIRLMVAGKGIEGTYRTYIKIPDIKGKLAGYFVESAYITVYESGDCEANQTIRFNRINESWTSTSLTWNNKPEHNSTAINSFTTEGKQYASHKVKATNTIRSYIDNTNNSNYGIVMRNVTSSPDFAEFYGSRTSLTSYRPKLVVTYSDKPTAPSSVTVTKEYLKSEETLNVQWAGITSAGLDRVEYRIAKYNDDGTVEDSSYVPWSTLKTTTSSSGSASIDVSSFTNRKQYRIYIRGVDQCDNAGSSKSEIFYTDRSYPTFETAEISPITTSSDRTNNKKPVVRWKIKETYFEAVKIYLGDELRSTVKSKESSYSLTDKDAEKLQHGENEIKLVAVDKAGNTNSKTLLYYVDLEGALITDLYTEPSATSWSSSKNDKTPVVHWDTSATDVAKVQLLLDDVSIYSTSTIDKSISILEKHFTNVDEKIYEFTLKLTDKAGNVTSKTVDYYFDGKNPIIDSFSIVPDSGTLSMTNDTTPTIKWTVTENHLDKVYYSLDGGTYKEAGTSTTGNFSLPAITTDGTHKIKIKAVDKAGNSVVSGELTYYLDITKPVFSSKSIDPQATSSAPKNNTQPEISWNITETNLDKVYYSINSTASADYVQMSTAKSGTFTIPAGKLTTTKEYTIRLKAIDKAGNVSAVQTLSYYLDVTKPVVSGVTTDPATSSVSLKKNLTPVISWTSSEAQPAKVEYQIDDKSYKQAGTAASGSFTIPEGEITTSGVHTIRVRMTDKAGNVSSPVGTSYHVDVDAPVFSSLEMTKSSFLFPSANRAPQITWKIEDAAMKNVYYSVNGGESACVNSGAEGSVTLPETVWGDKENGKFVISVYAEDAAGNMCEAKTLTYYLKSVENPEEYVPKNITVTESYGKRVITWKLPAYDGTKASYTLHRGTDVDFVPSNENLVTDDFDVTSLLYIDNEILEAGTYYYKIAVKDLTGDEGAEDYVSDAVAFENTVTIEQFSNRLGLKDYLSYLEIGLPMGTMHIEESRGNLVYDQNDYSFVAPAFSMDMDRTYNSMSKRTTMVGVGWSDSYHQEIYTYGDDLYFVDTDGSAYFFERQADDSFACDETKEMTVEKTNGGYTITSKDKVVSTFNESGQLITTTEPNGYVLENVYDQMGRLAEVRLIHGETEIRNLEFAYIENSYLLDSVILPDESVMEYSYSGESLTSAVYGGITYAYQYDDNGLLNTVYDGEGNPYTVSYEDGKVIQATYPDGEKFQLAYNVDNTNKTEIKKFAADGGHFYTEYTTFNPQTGKMLSHTDPAGETVSYTYGDERNPYLLTESYKEVSYYTLDEEAEKVYESSLEKKVLSAFVYDNRENIISEISEDGSVTTYTYCTSTEENPNLVKYEITKRDGMTTSEMDYVYDDRGNVKQTTDRVSRQVTDYILDDYGNVLTETVRENGITLSISVNTYDIYGNVLSTESTEGGITTSTAYTYDIMGKILTTVSPGAETSYTYDEAGREIETETEEEGLEPVITTKSYDDNSALLSENSSNGIACEYSYDDRNRVISQIVSGEDMEPRTTVTDYGTVGPAGNKVYMETVTTSGSASLFSSNTDSQTQIRYIDGTGKVLKEVDDMVQTEYTYDKAGNVLSAETATSDQGMVILEDRAAESVNTDDTVLTLYNKYGEAEVFITEPEAASDAAYRLSEDSLVSRQSFDGAGNLKTETSPEGITARYSYDTQGRLTGCDVDGDGTNDTTVSYSLTATGNTVTTITDANGNVRTETINAAGLVLETRDIASEEGADDLYTLYTYDEQGRKLSEVYSDESRIEYVYTSVNSSRVFTETAYRSDGTEDSCITYSYDDYGRVSSVTVSRDGNTVSTTSWTYDGEGKKLSETVSYGNQPGQTTQYTYDVFGRLASVQYPDESGLGTVTYTYDTAGNISKISNGEGTIREYGYVHMGQIDYIRDYRIPKTESVTPPYIDKYYSYDNNGRTTAMRTQDADGVILETFSYEYDQNSQIIEEIHVNNLPEEAKQINETTSYTYDDFGRLTQSVKTDHQNSNVRLVTAYGYDDVGNRISMTENGAETAYTYNSLNQLLSSAENGENTTYAYDGRGNQITETKDNVVTESTYSVKGEMLTLTKRSGNTVLSSQENQYNHEGIRISKKEDGVTRRYYYDNGVIAYTKDGTTLSSANVTGPEGQVVGTFRGDDYHVYLKDIQGSTTSIVKDDGSLSAAYAYRDFGETEEITGSSFDNEICYTGAVYDDTTGLYYMNARYYDPANGRFISQDTYRGELNDHDQWHLYVYCANNPINYVDPSGHYVITVGIKNESVFVFGKFKMLAINVDSKYVSVTWSEGYKITTNIGYSWSLIVSYDKKATVDSILGKGRSISANYGIGALSGSVTVSSGGYSSYGGSVSVGGMLSPISIDYEKGKTTELKRWKKKTISSKLKEYYIKGVRITTKRMTNYSRFRIQKGRVQANVYNNGKVKIQKY